VSGQHEIALDCSKLNAGIYSIRLTAGTKVFTEKITVKK
jgi:hypothetical protein